MESAQAPIIINYVVYTRVEDVKPANFGGWWVQFEGSRESLHFSAKEPPYSKGQRIKITFEKVIEYAIPEQPPI